MSKFRPEPTQKGNPHRLSINQHVFPAASIARFASDNGGVAVFDKIRRTARYAKPQDPIFCARRTWDHRSEVGFMKDIEDDFQTLVVKIVSSGITLLSAEDQAITNGFFSLWAGRAQARHRGNEPQKINGLKGGGKGYTIDEEEQLEAAGMGFVRANGEVPARIIQGSGIIIGMNRYARDVAPSTRWGVVFSPLAEFVVPDYPVRTVIPIAPQMALASITDGGFITYEGIRDLNREAIGGSKQYFFARDLTKIAA